MIIVNDAMNMHKTFPLIFQNGRFIGGYNELYYYNKLYNCKLK